MKTQHADLDARKNESINMDPTIAELRKALADAQAARPRLEGLAYATTADVLLAALPAMIDLMEAHFTYDDATMPPIRDHSAYMDGAYVAARLMNKACEAARRLRKGRPSRIAIGSGVSFKLGDSTIHGTVVADLGHVGPNGDRTFCVVADFHDDGVAGPVAFTLREACLSLVETSL